MTYWHAAYRDHGPAVLAYLCSRMPRADAEDLLQETFVRAIRASGNLRDDGKLRPYLLTIAHNLMVNRLRRARPHLFVASTGSDGEEIDQESTDPNPEQEANMARLEERLDQVVATMTPKLRTAFEQAVLRQEPYKAIARANGWSLAQVKVNVFRARRFVIAHLREYLPPEEC